MSTSTASARPVLRPSVATPRPRRMPHPGCKGHPFAPRAPSPPQRSRRQRLRYKSRLDGEPAEDSFLPNRVTQTRPMKGRNHDDEAEEGGRGHPRRGGQESEARPDPPTPRDPPPPAPRPPPVP